MKFREKKKIFKNKIFKNINTILCLVFVPPWLSTNGFSLLNLSPFLHTFFIFYRICFSLVFWSHSLHLKYYSSKVPYSNFFIVVL